MLGVSKMVDDKLELVQWFKLGMIKGLGPIKLQRLVEIFGNVENVFNAPHQKLLGTRIVKERMLPELEKFKKASNVNYVKAIQECISHNIHIIPLIDSRYPSQLKRMPYPPLTLYLWGNMSLLESRKIAIVGTRQPSNEAKKITFEFSNYFADIGLTVISGGAEGIDTEAHKGALNSKIGKTICVCGTGFFYPYPPQNQSLFDKIRESNGLLISEHLPNFSGSRFSFIQRNRITSGLSVALLICASGKTGGSMVQTRVAKEQRIPIFCFAMDMNVKPNIGIAIAIEKFGAQEIHTPQELINKLDRQPLTLNTI